MSGDDISFLRRRAREEAELAGRATVPEAAWAHAKMAAAYAALLEAAEPLEPERRAAGSFDAREAAKLLIKPEGCRTESG